MSRTLAALVLVLTACPEVDKVVDDEPVSYSVVEVRQIERPCFGDSGALPVHRDLGEVPVWWQVDIGYDAWGDDRETWVWEAMVPDPDRRAWNTANWPESYALNTVEVYQRGSVVTFPCGYPTEDGLYLRDEGFVSRPMRYRITYGVVISR